MIEGMKVDIAAEELVRHLRDRATFYQDIARMGRESLRHWDRDNPKDKAIFNATDSEARINQAKANRFTRLAEHMILGETYRLGEHDLKLMEWW